MHLVLLLSLALLLFLPSDALDGARNGLLLWFNTVLPTLFPFLFLSSMLIRTGLSHRISQWLRPLLCPLLRISTNCCYAVLIGLTSGYPLGAKTCADLVSSGHISTDEGQYLLCFCNNASPMFILSFLGTSLLGLPYRKCLLLWGIILLSAILTGALYRLLWHNHQTNIHTHAMHRPKAAPADILSATEIIYEITETSPLEASLETAIQTITKVGGYIILFSILGHLMMQIPFFPMPLSGFLAGILEITTGCHALAALALPDFIKIVLICAITAFGGLSSILQTKSVMGSSGLSVTTYVHTKILHTLLAAALSGILLSINIL